MGGKVTDPALLAELEGSTSTKVTDPALLAELDAPGPSSGMAAFRGAAQGASAGFVDELSGAAYAATQKARSALFNAPEADKPWGELYREGRDSARGQDAAAKAAHSKAFLGGEIGGGLATAVLAPVKAAQGAGLAARMAAAAANGATIGGLSGAGYSDAKDWSGVAKDAAFGAGVGGALGGAGEAVGSAVGAVKDRALSAIRNRISGIDTEALGRGLKKAVADTNAARGEAGRAATDAYKQVRNIEEFRDALPPSAHAALQDLEDRGLLEGLKAELAGKSVENLPAAAAKKIDTAQAFKDSVAGEAKRATDYAAAELSPEEAKRQVMARLKRYGLPALGGIIGNQMGGEDSPLAGTGVGVLAGAGAGALVGSGWRPMLHSFLRLGSNPAVNRSLLSAGESLLGGASSAAGALSRFGGAAAEMEAGKAGTTVHFPRLRAALGITDDQPMPIQVAQQSFIQAQTDPMFRARTMRVGRDPFSNDFPGGGTQ